MKLVLAKNQSKKFVDFYNQLQSESQGEFEYADYNSWLFVFGPTERVRVVNTITGKELSDYDGIYINGYLRCYELAATIAICADELNIPYVNRELEAPPSLSKLTAYAKLVSGGVRLPLTIAGSKKAILNSGKFQQGLSYPAIMKRADADRGVDNFKVKNFAEAKEFLNEYDVDSLWLLQEYIENKGYYLVSFYDQKPAFCIYRSLEKRLDGVEHKEHMYKPAGGANATLIDPNDIKPEVRNECQKAVMAMNRQVASVDCILSESDNKAYILEVNYNPQLVTIETFKDIRIKAFLEGIQKIKND